MNGATTSGTTTSGSQATEPIPVVQQGADGVEPRHPAAPTTCAPLSPTSTTWDDVEEGRLLSYFLDGADAAGGGGITAMTSGDVSLPSSLDLPSPSTSMYQSGSNHPFHPGEEKSEPTPGGSLPVVGGGGGNHVVIPAVVLTGSHGFHASAAEALKLNAATTAATSTASVKSGEPPVTPAVQFFGSSSSSQKQQAKHQSSDALGPTTTTPQSAAAAYHEQRKPSRSTSPAANTSPAVPLPAPASSMSRVSSQAMSTSSSSSSLSSIAAAVASGHGPSTVFQLHRKLQARSSQIHPNNSVEKLPHSIFGATTPDHAGTPGTNTPVMHHQQQPQPSPMSPAACVMNNSVSENMVLPPPPRLPLSIPSPPCKPSAATTTATSTGQPLTAIPPQQPQINQFHHQPQQPQPLPQRPTVLQQAPPSMPTPLTSWTPVVPGPVKAPQPVASATTAHSMPPPPAPTKPDVNKQHMEWLHHMNALVAAANAARAGGAPGTATIPPFVVPSQAHQQQQERHHFSPATMMALGKTPAAGAGGGNAQQLPFMVPTIHPTQYQPTATTTTATATTTTTAAPMVTNGSGGNTVVNGQGHFVFSAIATPTTAPGTANPPPTAPFLMDPSKAAALMASASRGGRKTAAAAAAAVAVGAPRSAAAVAAACPAETAEKRARRLARNRESARQSRRRKKELLEGLSAKTADLQAQLEADRWRHLESMESSLSSLKRQVIAELHQDNQQERLAGLLQETSPNTPVRRAAVDFCHSTLRTSLLPLHQHFLLWLLQQPESYFTAGKEERSRNLRVLGRVSSKQIGEDLTAEIRRQQQQQGGGGDSAAASATVSCRANEAARLWPLLSYDLSLSVDQEERILTAHRGIVQRRGALSNDAEKLARAMNTISHVRSTLLAQTYAAGQRQEAVLQSILTPDQSTRYLQWLEKKGVRSLLQTIQKEKRMEEDVCELLQEVLRLDKDEGYEKN